jgi:hypothetical protein
MSIASQLSFLMSPSGGINVIATGKSISTTTGAVVNAGGIGIAGTANIGGSVAIGSTATVVGSVLIGSTASIGGYIAVTTATIGSYATAGSSIPKITSITQTAGASYVATTATAVNTSGGYILVNGSGFQPTPQIMIGTLTAVAVTFVNSTLLRVQVPAQNNGTYIVYVNNPDGGLAINVPGLTYNDFPAWASGSTLPTFARGGLISIQLAATDSVGTVVYGVTSSTSLPAGLTLSLSGLLSGSISTASVATIYNFTVYAQDIYSQQTSQTFNITITPGDSSFSGVVLLINGNQPITSSSTSNNIILDISTLSNSISRSGLATQGNFSPFVQTGYSNYFNGSSSYLYLSQQPQFAFGTGTFTIEAWVYPTTYPSTTSTIFNNWSTTVGNTQIGIVIANSGTLQLQTWNTILASSTASSVNLNTWTHIAASYDGTTYRTFVNGVLGTTSTTVRQTLTTATNLAYIGASPTTTPAYYFNGYINNLRVINGNAIYTATFTTPTAPLSTNTTGTVLLTCQTNRILDASTYSFTLTNTNIVLTQPYVPFESSRLWTTSTNGGSLWFDGSSGILSIASAASLNMSSLNFTIECWSYVNSITGSYQTIISNRSSGGTGWEVGINPSSGLFYYYNGSAVYTSSTPVVPGVWTHLAATYDGSNLRLFQNGVITLVQSGVAATNSTQPTYIGGVYNTSQLYAGYVSNLRVVKGTALYTTTFVPATTIITGTTNTIVLLPGTNSAIYDLSSSLDLATVGNAQISSLTNPFNAQFGYSTYFNGTNGYVSVPNGGPITFGSSNFTIEFWAYLNSTASEWCAFHTYNANYQGILISVNGGGAGKWRFYSGNGSWYMTIDSSFVVPINTWNHVAAVRSSSSWYLWVNGSLAGVASGISTNPNQDTNPITVGSFITGTPNYFNGYISNLRVTIGTALYQSTFTPSTTPLNPSTGTVLLICQTGGFIDTSIYGLPVTANGSVVNAPFSSFYTSNGQSILLNGSTDYIYVPARQTLVFNTGSFTIECWAIPTYVGNTMTLLDWWIAGSGSYTTGQWQLQTDSSNRLSFNYATGPSTFATVTATYGLSLASWQHIAVVRNSTNVTMYINGVAVGVGTNSVTTIGVNAAGSIGRQTNSNNNFWQGCVYDIRITNGIARYTSNFTPPSTSLPGT